MDYDILERDFIERTIALLNQYETFRLSLPIEEQYNHTLLLNCLLGMIILPKEIYLAYISTDRVMSAWGIVRSKILDEDIKTIRDLVIALRHSIAHFQIEVMSETESKEIKTIKFNNTEKGTTIIDFNVDEMLPFLKKLGDELIKNLDKNKYHK